MRRTGLTSRPGPCFGAALLLAAAAIVVACVPVKAAPKQSKTEAAEYNMQLGVTYLRQGELPAAQEKLERAVAQDGSLATAHSALAIVYERMGDLPGAEREHRRAVSLKPDDPDILNGIAVFLCSNKPQPTEAMAYFERALAIPLSKAYYNRAMLLANAGLCAKRYDLAKAEEYLRQALNADPGYNEALLQLADVAWQRGNYLQGRAFVERYMGAVSATAPALLLAWRIERSLGDSQAAGRYAARLQKDFPESVETSQLLEQTRNAGH
jgi:type IV pilus assembly protein PilF